MQDMDLTLFLARVGQAVRHPRERVLVAEDVASGSGDAPGVGLVPTQDPPLAVRPQRRGRDEEDAALHGGRDASGARQIELVQEHGGGRAAAFGPADDAVEGPFLLDDVAHVVERHGGGVMKVLGGRVCRPHAPHLVFRLAQVLERERLGEFAEALTDGENGVVKVEEVGRRTLVLDVGRGLDVV